MPLTNSIDRSHPFIPPPHETLTVALARKYCVLNWCLRALPLHYNILIACKPTLFIVATTVAEAHHTYQRAGCMGKRARRWLTKIAIFVFCWTVYWLCSTLGFGFYGM